ncbi:MAG: hypothetical protein AB7L84_06105 [Acidimicrobiia bacterium]
MSAPTYVPSDVNDEVRSYSSPPRRPQSWRAERPAELAGLQPRGDRLGNPGPDQGYILTLARGLAGRLVLAPGEHARDVLAAAAAVGLKRASLFGRAPVVHDLTVALTAWGFLGEAPAELVELRRSLFEEVSSPHHYEDLRRIVDLVPDEVLRRTPAQVAEAHTRDWRSLLALPAEAWIRPRGRPLPSPG